MFLGLFVFAAGLTSLLETLGVINSDVRWGVPLAVTCFGLHLIYEAFKRKQNVDKSI